MARTTHEPDYDKNPADKEYERLFNRGGVPGSTSSPEPTTTSSTSGSSPSISSVDGSGLSAAGPSPTKPKHLDGERGFYTNNPTPVGRLKINWTRRKKWLVGGTTAGVVGGGAVFFMFFSGPMQFIHFAQLLQKFHFSNNENFGDTRSSRMIIYSMAGQPGRARLGYVGNKYADSWEQRIVKETGLRPVYTKGTNRFAGFEVVDQNKARAYIADAEKDGINTNARDNNVRRTDGNTAGRFIDYRGDKFRAKRSAIRTVGKGTQTNKLVGAMSSRLLIKRGGVDFHPLKNIRRSAGDSLVSYYQKLKDERAQRDRRGVTALDGGVETRGDEDNDGNRDSTAEEEEAKKKSDEIIDNSKKASSEGAAGKKTLDSLRAGLTKSAGPVLVVGAMCTVKSFGKDIEQHQHQIIILPMLRMGFRIVSTGNQVMSGQDVNMDELGSIADDLTDPDEDGKGPDTGSSWASARSIQAELGEEQTGPDLPIEARPSRVGEEPRIIRAVNAVPGVDQACGVLSAVSNLPIIKQVSAAGAKMVTEAADFALENFGTSVEELMQSAVSLAAGGGVDPYAKGAELGNIANYGARLAANDQALAMGGRKLSDSEVTALDVNSQDIFNLEEKSFASKYIDPYDYHSAIGQAAYKAPKIHEITGIATKPLAALTAAFGSLSNLLPETQAANNYDYGFDEYGFSINEQVHPDFENPFENAEKVEPKLHELNEKYGDCFSMTVEIDEGTERKISLNTSEAVNYKNLPSKCNESYETNPELTQYRFYLADAVTAISLDCYEGDEDSCRELGLASNASSAAGSAETLSYLNGYKLTATQSRWIKYIAENVKSKLPGSDVEQAEKAARVTWWSLKEGVLGKENLVAYNNCGSGDGNTPIGVVETCPAKTWQVGMAAVQVPNFSLERVETTAKDRNPGLSLTQILSEVARIGGYSEGSAIYKSIISSSGDLRKSLLLRDPATGFTLVDTNITNECIDRWESWCNGSWEPANILAQNQATAKRVISELASYYNGSTSGPVSGDLKSLAQQILKTENIDLSSSNFCRYCYEDIKNTADGKPAYGSVHLSINLLKFLLELGQKSKVDVNSISGAGSGHSSNSNHFRGIAIDFGCSLDVKLADSVGRKYGIARYSGEWCPDHGHWHYSTSGN